MEKLSISALRELMPYLSRIDEIFDMKDNDTDLKIALRHVEILRIQLSNELPHIKPRLDELQYEFLCGILSDSYYFEKYQLTNDLKWKFTFIRFTWNRLLEELNMGRSEKDVFLMTKAYADYFVVRDGRSTYKKYEG